MYIPTNTEYSWGDWNPEENKTTTTPYTAATTTVTPPATQSPAVTATQSSTPTTTTRTYDAPYQNLYDFFGPEGRPFATTNTPDNSWDNGGWRLGDPYIQGGYKKVTPSGYSMESGVQDTWEQGVDVLDQNIYANVMPYLQYNAGSGSIDGAISPDYWTLKEDHKLPKNAAWAGTPYENLQYLSSIPGAKGSYDPSQNNLFSNHDLVRWDDNYGYTTPVGNIKDNSPWYFKYAPQAIMAAAGAGFGSLASAAGAGLGSGAVSLGKNVMEGITTGNWNPLNIASGALKTFGGMGGDLGIPSEITDIAKTIAPYIGPASAAYGMYNTITGNNNNNTQQSTGTSPGPTTSTPKAPAGAAATTQTTSGTSNMAYNPETATTAPPYFTGDQTTNTGKGWFTDGIKNSLKDYIGQITGGGSLEDTIQGNYTTQGGGGGMDDFINTLTGQFGVNPATIPNILSAFNSFYSRNQYADLPDKYRDTVDPFGRQRGYYADKLRASYENPTAFLNDPGHLATQNLQNAELEGKLRASGYLGSGKYMTDIGKQNALYDASFLQQERKQLGDFAGAQFDGGRNMADLIKTSVAGEESARNAALAAAMAAARGGAGTPNGTGNPIVRPNTTSPGGGGGPGGGSGPGGGGIYNTNVPSPTDIVNAKNLVKNNNGDYQSTMPVLLQALKMGMVKLEDLPSYWQSLVKVGMGGDQDFTNWSTDVGNQELAVSAANAGPGNTGYDEFGGTLPQNYQSPVDVAQNAGTFDYGNWNSQEGYGGYDDIGALADEYFFGDFADSGDYGAYFDFGD